MTWRIGCNWESSFLLILFCALPSSIFNAGDIGEISQNSQRKLQINKWSNKWNNNYYIKCTNNNNYINVGISEHRLIIWCFNFPLYSLALVQLYQYPLDSWIYAVLNVFICLCFYFCIVLPLHFCISSFISASFVFLYTEPFIYFSLAVSVFLQKAYKSLNY